MYELVAPVLLGIKLKQKKRTLQLHSLFCIYLMSEDVRTKQDQTLLWTCVAGACLCVNSRYAKFKYTGIPGRVAQSVTCLVTDAKLTADPGVASSIPARSHTFVEIDREIISTFILPPSAESFMKGCCQLQAKVCARLLVNCLFKLAQEKSVVR